VQLAGQRCHLEKLFSPCERFIQLTARRDTVASNGPVSSGIEQGTLVQGALCLSPNIICRCSQVVPHDINGRSKSLQADPRQTLKYEKQIHAKFPK
jgi:hypothetical protein